MGARLYLTFRLAGIPEDLIQELLKNIDLILNDAEYLNLDVSENKQFELYRNREQ